MLVSCLPLLVHNCITASLQWLILITLCLSLTSHCLLTIVSLLAYSSLIVLFLSLVSLCLFRIVLLLADSILIVKSDGFVIFGVLMVVQLSRVNKMPPFSLAQVHDVAV